MVSKDKQRECSSRGLEFASLSSQRRVESRRCALKAAIGLAVGSAAAAIATACQSPEPSMTGTEVCAAIECSVLVTQPSTTEALQRASPVQDTIPLMMPTEPEPLREDIKVYVNEVLDPALVAAGLRRIEDSRGVTDDNEFIVSQDGECAALFGIDPEGHGFRLNYYVVGPTWALTDPYILAQDGTPYGYTQHVEGADILGHFIEPGNGEHVIEGVIYISQTTSRACGMLRNHP